jgi:hypothetical protein
VTSADIDLAFIELLPISIAVLFAGQVPVLAKLSACVRLSAQTITLLTVELFAAVATPPAIKIPAKNAAVTFTGVPLNFMV